MTEWELIQERFKLSFFPIYFIIEHMTGDLSKVAGKSLHKLVAVHHGAHVQYWAQTNKWKELQDACLQKIQEKPIQMSKLVQELRKKSPEFLGFIKKVHETDLSQKNNRELWEYYNQYCTHYKKLGLLGEPFAISVKDTLAQYLEKYLKQKLNERGLEKKFPDYFSTLVSPTTPSFATREEQELIKIALKAQKSGLKSVQPELAKHTQNFFWLPYDYEGEIWEKKYFESILKELLQKDSDLKQQAEKLEKKFEHLKGTQQAIIQEIQMNKTHQQLFHALRDSSEAMDFKKEMFTQSHWYKNRLMQEIAKRLGIPFYHTYFLMQKEAKKGLLENKLNKEMIEKYDVTNNLNRSIKSSRARMR